MESIEKKKERLIFIFGGENDIDINLLVNTLSGISESYKNVIYSKVPEANVELKIEAFNKGSFEINISSTISAIPPIIQGIQLAIPYVNLFLDIIKLKKNLKGKRPKKIITEGNKSKIINENGETYYYDCEVTNIYMVNPMIDKGLTDVFSALNGDKTRKAVSFKNDNEEVAITEQDYEDMAENIIEQADEKSDKHIENEIVTELLLKKPDLLGESKWQFQYNGKIISTVIEDKEFLHKVRCGEIKTLYAHVRVPVKMKIEVLMDDKLEIIKKKYTILKVVGDIIEPEFYEQIKLNE